MAQALFMDHQRVRFEAAFHESSICHTVARLFTQNEDAADTNKRACGNLILLVGYRAALESPRNCNCTSKLPLSLKQFRISRLLPQDFAAFAVILIFGGLRN